MALRVLLLLGVFATHPVMSWGTRFPKIISPPVTQFFQKGCEIDVNYIRRRYAAELFVGNMNQLVFDNEITEILGNQKVDCSKNFFETETHYGEVYRQNPLDMGGGLLSPGATKMACVTMQCSTPSKDKYIAMMVVDSQPYEGIQGDAGTKCGNGRVGVDGLCVKDLSRNVASK